MYQDIFMSIAGNESADAADLSKAEVALVEVCAEEAAEAFVEKEISEQLAQAEEFCAVVEKHDAIIESLEEKVEDLEEQIGGMESQMTGATAFNPALFASHFNKAAKIASTFGRPTEIMGAESFGSIDGCEAAAGDKIKSMKETAGKAYAAGKKFLETLFENVVKAITAFFNAHEQMAKKADAMLKAIDGKETKDGKITIPNVLNANGSDDYATRLGQAFSLVQSAGDEEATAGKIKELLVRGTEGTQEVNALSIADCKARLKEVSDYGRTLADMKRKAEAIVKGSWGKLKEIAVGDSSVDEKISAGGKHNNLRKSVSVLLGGIKETGTILKAKLKAVQDSVVSGKKEEKKD